jgi:hypothetical protein
MMHGRGKSDFAIVAVKLANKAERSAAELCWWSQGNPYLKVFTANGYYDAVTPFFQTVLNFENMPLSDPHARNNLTIHNYPSGHMVYLDNESRSAMRADLAAFYEGTRAYSPAVAARRAPQETGRMSMTPIRQRCFNGSPHRPWAAARRELLCCGAVSASAPALPLHCSRRDWP